MTEIAQYNQPSTLDVQMRYAQTVTASAMLPKHYQNNPANALIAIGLGDAMGLSPAESLYRIDVIQGKPTASAELIAANVRKAGHKLRITQDRENVSVTATIVRKDDPDYPISVTRDMAWAKEMGLTSKENYRKQPLTMLEWRAVSAVARIAASETLYGVAWTADELYDMAPATARQEPPQAPQEPVTIRRQAPEEVTVEEVTDEPTPEPASDEQIAALLEWLSTREGPNGRQWLNERTGRELTGPGDITADEAARLIEELSNA